MTYPSRRARATTAGLALLAVAFAPALQQLPATAAGSGDKPSLPAPVNVSTIGDPVPGLSDLSLIGGAEPSLEQQAEARALGDVTMRWNSYGTPASILPADGSLGRASGPDAVASARSWLADHHELLGLRADQVASLELVDDHVLTTGSGVDKGSAGHVVLLEQTFDGLEPARGSLVSVSVANGQIAYVSSSLAKVTQDFTAPSVTGSQLTQGWVAAAANVGREVEPGKVGDIVANTVGAAAGGWTTLTVPGFADQQTVRLRALALADGSVRPVLQSNVLDGLSAFAYTVLVDASTGKVLGRQNQVDNASDVARAPLTPITVSGTYSETQCGTSPFEITDDTTKSIVATLTGLGVGVDDITLQLIGPAPASAVLTSADVATSPEVLTYTAASIPRGIYTIKVCAYEGTAPLVGQYAGLVALSDTALPGGGGTSGGLPDPKWRFFTANPRLDYDPTTNGQDNSVVGCWSVPTSDCTAPNGTLESITSMGPWDTVAAGVPSLTTSGNNAVTHEAWASPLSPGGLFQAPISPTRDYTAAAPPTSGTYTDVWNNSGCSPTNLVPGGNDINAVTENLFVGHNQIHDWAYALGFTEKTYNLQLSNSGKGGTGGDPEVGNVQAGAIVPADDPTGELPVTGRDNANQIALMDGVPGITNQYLFQPLAGAFYSPCADGSLDTSIFGHEYTHAISNRMIAGPNDGIASEQGGAMGESWGDLDAGEYMYANGYSPGPNPWAVGPYATGNPVAGIRDYPINANPLNYSDYGFDTTGAEVHADGEIWNGTQWEVRDALATSLNSRFPYFDKQLQRKCAKSTGSSTPLDSSFCPGNRRWIQLIFDAFIPQQTDTDMLDARDAMIAADVARYGGADVDTLWAAFARRGMGQDAKSSITVPTDDPAVTAEDVTEPVPSFSTPNGPNSAVTFSTVAGSTGKFYVGDFEARATPIADNDPATPLGSTASFTPGRYTITYVSATNGQRRVVMDVPATGAAVAQRVDDTGDNYASALRGATIIGATEGSLNPAYLIDGTESTNYGYVDPAGTINVDESHPAVSVDLAGAAPVTISSVKVSALLVPAPAAASTLPVVAGPLGTTILDKADEDPTSGSRFTALRKFAVETCVTDCASDTATWTRAYTSADDAFPGDVPRPVAPNQTMRTFNFAAPVTASAVRLVTLENQCTGQARYADESGSYTDPATGDPALEADPESPSDCKTGSDRGTIVHASELQVFGIPMAADPVTPGTGVPGVTETGAGVPGATTATSPVSATPGKVKVKTRTRIRLPRIQQIRGKESTRMKFQVVSKTTSNGSPAGVAIIKLDGRKVKKVVIAVTLKRGKKVVGNVFRVPKSLAYGKHHLQVIFKSSDPSAFTSSKSRRIVLTVVKVRGPAA
jgi:extracellular elastinolytic metalloproteinase